MKSLVLLSVLRKSDQGQDVENGYRNELSRRYVAIEGEWYTYTQGKAAWNRVYKAEACPETSGGEAGFTKHRFDKVSERR